MDLVWPTYLTLFLLGGWIPSPPPWHLWYCQKTTECSTLTFCDFFLYDIYGNFMQIKFFDTFWAENQPKNDEFLKFCFWHSVYQYLQKFIFDKIFEYCSFYGHFGTLFWFLKKILQFFFFDLGYQILLNRPWGICLWHENFSKKCQK